ncbi:hypothetical protein K431DRAFT_334482 [Polychaeton citri CBS 116435]|uniref:Uncharacterized protein n=1 Tax=Polychaeton citri CBS 116435 TaxID=1314669 RepID=A0A9P4ULE6_9PEZI|nr:hypothetical protein K431DRAFT_334482 [Polychaeton citri CBS 116435]
MSTPVLGLPEAYTFLHHHLPDLTTITINKEVEMTAAAPENLAMPQSSVPQHSSQIQYRTVFSPATRPSVRHASMNIATSAMETNMTQAQLYQWNPVLGNGGVNCQTQLQDGY